MNSCPASLAKPIERRRWVSQEMSFARTLPILQTLSTRLHALRLQHRNRGRALEELEQVAGRVRGFGAGADAGREHDVGLQLGRQLAHKIDAGGGLAAWLS
jgi:hypothetical protein